MITAFSRTILLYLLIVVGMRLMGKRQIGELEPSELVLTMMISDLASVTLDELLEELREQGYSNLQDIKYAILENSGQLSVFPWTAQQPPTTQQMGLNIQDDVTLPMVLINDGRVNTKNLTACGRDIHWLQKQLTQKKISSPQEVFLLTLDEQGSVFCVKKEAAS